MTIRQRTWDILEAAKEGDTISRIFDVFIISLIFLNVIAVIIGSVESIEKSWGAFLDVFEIVSVAIFTIEYIARLWSCIVVPRFSKRVVGRLRYAYQPLSLIDFCAIVPFYLPFLGIDLRSLRILRLFRVLRIAKAGRYYSSFYLIKQVLYNKKEELILTSVLMGFLLIISSSVLYCCENTVQPDVFSSIPATMWWAIITLTTVGYGDIYPVTSIGKICAGIISMLGIGMFALPTGILGAGFVEEIQKHKGNKKFCPHCGNELK